MSWLNNFLFVALPYVAVVMFCVGAVYRYRASGFQYSSLSSQFLEGRGSYLFSMLFHWGILLLFIGHLLAFLFPAMILAWQTDPVRLVAGQIVALALGFGVLIGLTGLLVRRILRPRLWVVTSRMDLVIELLLLAQIVLGLWTALGYRWGYYWFAADLSPYLWSVVKLNPQIEAVSAMPLVIQAHIVGAFLILGMIPFTRLVHFLVAPFHYLWRRQQLVMWYWDRKRVRDPGAGWTETRPGNN